MFDFIATPFGYVLKFIYGFVQNYGLALAIFAVLVKLILVPFTAKSKKSMMKMSRLQPQLKQLEIACGDDKQKLQQEQMALYKEEGVSMFGGCLWSFLPLLFLLPMFTVIREPMKNIMGLTEDQIKQICDSLINIKGATKTLEDGTVRLLTVDKFVNKHPYWQFEAAGDIELYGKGIVENVSSLKLSLLGMKLGDVPKELVGELGLGTYIKKVFTSWRYSCTAIIPLLSGALNWLTMFISQKMNNTVVRDENGEKTETAAGTAQTGKIMNLLMPVISVVFGFLYPLGLSVYWLTQSAFSIVQDVLLTKHYRKVYDAEDEVKRQKAAQRAAEEAEKERIRAARRAANPDGITENTSKKKQQLREKQEREKAAKDYEARKLAEQGITPEDKLPEGVDSARPFSRGRAYSPEHYHSEQQDKE